VQLLYYMPAFQYLVALIIFLSFAANVWEAQVINVAPRPDWMNPFFRDLDVVFTVIFTVELAMNLVASGARGFVTSGWNWIDFVVVILAYVGTIFDVSSPRQPLTRTRRIACSSRAGSHCQRNSALSG